MLKVGVMVSGGGTNLQAILDAVDAGKIRNASIEVVVSNNPGAYALERAKNHGIPAVCLSPKDFESREAFNEAFLAKVDEYDLDLIVLAGFLVKIPEAMVEKYEHRIINVHPSLDPVFLRRGILWLKGARGGACAGREGDWSHGSLRGRRHGHRPDHSPEGGGGTSRRHAGGSAAPRDGAGGVGDSAEGDRYDCKSRDLSARCRRRL